MRFRDLAAAGRYRDALTDPARAYRAVLISLAAYTVLWAIYGTIAKGSQGLHYDMTEVIAWSRDLDLGYLKHPPLAAGIVWLWFSVFPVAEWSYYLLAMTMAAIALWFAWKLSADYLDIEKRVVGLALLTLVPFFNFHALKFNVNTVLIPLWAMTTFWSLRSFETRSRLYAALAGIGAAGCMLGKYWSVLLLAGLALAALIDTRRGQYFRSAAPWITIAAGLIVLAPHVIWLVQHDFAPFRYALIVHGDKPVTGTLTSLLGYLGGSIGYVAIPLIVVFVASWPSRTMLADMIWPRDPKRQAGCGRVLGTVSVADVRRGRERHRNHVAVVDAGLDAAAGAAVVAAAGDDPPDRHAAHSRGRRRGAAGDADRRAGLRHQGASQRSAAGRGARTIAGDADRTACGISRRCCRCALSAAMPRSPIAWPLMPMTGRTRCPDCRRRPTRSSSKAAWCYCVLPRTSLASARSARRRPIAL